MNDINGAQRAPERTLLRIGAVCAILGTIFSVAAGIGFGNLTNELGTEDILRYISSRPDWYWPMVHLGFIFGALLWVGALTALAGSLDGSGWALGRLGAASVVIGATVHVVDSSMNGFGLSTLADTRASAPAAEQASLLLTGDTLLTILGGTWASVLSLFHGVPFILFGLAVVFSRGYPTWLGWLGFAGGLGSLTCGALMFLGVSLAPEPLFIVFALVVSLFMLVMGVLMWRNTIQNGESSLEKEE